MVATLPPPGSAHHEGGASLPPPILPTVVHSHKGKKREDQFEHERGANLVLECLKAQAGESKTFGENIIFILNRASQSSTFLVFAMSRSLIPSHWPPLADGSPDSLCVSLLILKILYLLFTTSGTQEYFYTNDLCVLVDVFIRELCDLGEESEGVSCSSRSCSFASR